VYSYYVGCVRGFNLPRGAPLRHKWAMIPDDCDILMTHGPPLGESPFIIVCLSLSLSTLYLPVSCVGYGDYCATGHRAGCYDLLQHIQHRIRPSHHIFGHIHESYGMTTNGNITYVNACSCNVEYDRTNLNPPIVLDLPKKRAERMN